MKNFAFMIDADHNWCLSPAYDLMFSKGPGGEHSMSLVGEGLTPGKKEIEILGQKSGILKNKIDQHIEQVMAESLTNS